MHIGRFSTKNIALLTIFMAANLALSTPVLGQTVRSGQTYYQTRYPYIPHHQENRLGLSKGEHRDTLYTRQRALLSASARDTAYTNAIDALQNNNPHRAQIHLTHVLGAYRNHSPANYLMGLAKIDQGKKNAAREHLKRAVKYDPDFAYARMELAQLYVKAGKTDDAQEQIAWLEHAISACGGTCQQAGDLTRGRAAIVAAMASEKS